MFNFKSSDNKTTIQAAVWKAESKPIGVIQLVKHDALDRAYTACTRNNRIYGKI